MMRGTLGLGGNLGDPVATMAEALRRLGARDDLTILGVSRLFRTPPWGKLDQPWFVNACAEIQTSLEPEALLDACLDVERSLKRERGERWGPRTIDLDVLTLGDLSYDGERLTLPHPRLTSRAFVLLPLCDIAPELAIEGRTVRDWTALLDTAAITPLGEDRDWWRVG